MQCVTSLQTISKSSCASFIMDTSNNNSFSTETGDYGRSGSNNINQVWSNKIFNKFKGADGKKNYTGSNINSDMSTVKTTWSIKNSDDDRTSDDDDSDETQLQINKELASPTTSIPEKELVSPSHHARRPMNAFLIFCKKHRPIVRQRYPHLENRGVTRILGEWWALLDSNEKNCYTTLARQYKDAFFSANPDFKWYKLPAPPLRTLMGRPQGIQKLSSPLASPTQLTPPSAIFTPGKLADESQLGNLTSLMNMNNNNNLTTATKTFSNNNNSFEFTANYSFYSTNNFESSNEKEEQFASNAEIPILSKPIKKRLTENYTTQNEHNPVSLDNDHSKTNSDNVTQQELVDKVVDKMFPEENTQSLNTPKKSESDKGKSKAIRKSLRSCKGKRYAEFMMEGRIIGGKPGKHILNTELDEKIESTFSSEDLMHKRREERPATLNLNETIKRLADRTNNAIDIYDNDTVDDIIDEEVMNNERTRTESETSEESLAKLHADFNLDLRISSLPSLSYESFLQRKRESKKRKYFRSKSESSVSPTKVLLLSKPDDNLVGSKKRKNKHKITRLEKPPDSKTNCNPQFSNDLFGLATLAEVAANTQKMN